MEQFDLNKQWKLYLQRVCLVEEQLPERQRSEMKRCFYGACGQLLILMRDEVGELEEDAGIAVFENMMLQVANFFLKENNKCN